MLNIKYTYNLLLFVFITPVLFVFSGCDTQQNNQQELKISSETQRMIHRLDSIFQNIDPMSFRFMNNERLLILKSSMNPELTSININAYLKLAAEQLKAGDTIGSSQSYEEILTFVLNNQNLYSESLVSNIRKKLAISYLRFGEQSNCIALHNSSSCLFPINQEAIHLNKQGSEKALEHLTILLEKDPNSLSNKWLYTLAVQTLGLNLNTLSNDWVISNKYFKSDLEMPNFPNIGPITKTNFNDVAGGSITEDFNNDGYIDIFTSSWSLNGRLRLFINDHHGSFIDKTIDSGISNLPGGLNLISADYDNDGDTDVLILRGGWMAQNGTIPNSLLQNDGTGYFVDITESSGLLSYHPAQTAAWGDFDNDGWLDLVVGNESIGNQQHKLELFHNNHDGSFTEISQSANLNVSGYIKGVTWGDYNNDGLIDLYVSKLDQANQLYRNNLINKKPNFIDVSTEANIAKPIYSFATWFWDYNNDGWLDLFVADYDMKPYASNSNSNLQLTEIIEDYISHKPNKHTSRLYLNNKKGAFIDVTKQSKLDYSLLAMGANYGDIDNDGYLDLYVGTGAPNFSSLIPNRMFRNYKGQFFQDVTTTTGVGHLQKGHAISFADLDNDGDQDIYAVMGGAYSGDFFQNAHFENPGHNNNWITIKLIGTDSNRSAIGTRVQINIIEKGDYREVHRIVGTGGSFGANSLQLEIGLGQARQIEKLIINWPSGKVSLFENMVINQRIKIIEGSISINSY